ncbi:MAG: hypothetical protein ISS92_02890 [Candidatus Omnitrophica bacterium]|nr:hypothetical protein [Candidatus Omnitrophota bacterium]
MVKTICKKCRSTSYSACEYAMCPCCGAAAKTGVNKAEKDAPINRHADYVKER